MKVKVYYQDFSLNANAIVTKKLAMDVDNAVFIQEITEVDARKVYDFDVPHVPVPDYPVDKVEMANATYRIMNHLEIPVGHPDRPTFEKAGHTSMSIGDYIEFEDGELWVVASLGWKIVPPHDLSDEVKDNIRKVCASDEVADALIKGIEQREQTLTPCSYPMNQFYNYQEEVPEGTRVSDPAECEVCDETDCDLRHCLIQE